MTFRILLEDKVLIILKTIIGTYWEDCLQDELSYLMTDFFIYGQNLWRRIAYVP